MIRQNEKQTKGIQHGEEASGELVIPALSCDCLLLLSLDFTFRSLLTFTPPFWFNRTTFHLGTSS